MSAAMNHMTDLAKAPLTAPDIDDLLSHHAHALVRVIETATSVRRRYQFFVWAQSYLQTFVPHQLAVCGSYQRARKEIAFEAFNSIPVPSPVLSAVTDSGSALMKQLVGVWIERRGRAVVIDLHEMNLIAPGSELDSLIAAGFDELLVHGVSRPQRPAEIETLFMLSSPRWRCNQQQQMYFELLLPHVHSTWLRVQATERELAGAQAAGAVPLRPESTRSVITDREGQILFWVREGKSNQEIGDQLGISVLTVKNHVQKILRKLGAANRAQAVAKAMNLNLLHSVGRGS
jgi:transcriptional regulator EpsA